MKIYEKARYALNEGGVLLLLIRSWRKLKRMMGFIHNSHHWFSHAMPRGYPREEMALRNQTVTDNDILIAKRVLAAFHKAVEKNGAKKTPKGKDMWGFMEEKYHGDFIEILSSNDPRKLAEYLCRMYRQSITYGISNVAEYNELASSEKMRWYEAARTKDLMVSLAEVLGILPYENPGQDTFGENIYADSSWLANEIESKMGIEIAPPDIDGGVFKLRTGKGYFHSRSIYALYTAWRIRQLTEPKNASLCEIGAGVGMTALYASRFNFLDYSIFDLPRMNVVQAWYLIKGLPGRKVTLYGESAKPRNALKILPWWEFAKIQGKEYDLTLNEDGFPEMDKDIVAAYLNAVKKTTRRYFLSINHEFRTPMIPGQTEKYHTIVPKLVQKSGGFRRVYRFPYPLRKGYAEELYEIQP